jgi:hypothetical protein
VKNLPSEKSIVIFGAGKIGRSFIGQLFNRAGGAIKLAQKTGVPFDILIKVFALGLLFRSRDGEIFVAELN